LGTDKSTSELQQEIKALLKKTGISQAEFVKSYSDSSKDKVKKELDKFKKRLKRKTTKPDILKEYLENIYELLEHKKPNMVKLTSKLKNDNFSETFEKKMKEISKYIDEKIEDDE
jgi:acyl-CoA reductase-like NAD-dependent aldehyde dehydrogenase